MPDWCLFIYAYRDSDLWEQIYIGIEIRNISTSVDAPCIEIPDNLITILFVYFHTSVRSR